MLTDNLIIYTAWLNENGLLNGRIPAGTACPFLLRCCLRHGSCPTNENTRSFTYSCSSARVYSLLKHRKMNMV